MADHGRGSRWRLHRQQIRQTHWAALDGSFGRFALITFIDSVGSALYLSVSIIYFVKVVGLPAQQVGGGLSIALMIGLITSVPAGKCGDRFGHKRMLIAFNAAEALLFVFYPLVRSFTGFLAVVTLTALVETGASPVRRAFISELAQGESRVRVVAFNRAVYNVGFGVGSMAAGFALAANSVSGYHALMYVNAVSFAVAAMVIFSIRTPAATFSTTPPSVVAESARTNPRSVEAAQRVRRSPLRSPWFVITAAVCGLLYVNAAVLTVGLPLWIIRGTSAPRWTIAALLLWNTVISVFFQVRASRNAETVTGAGRANVTAGLALAIACMFFAVSGLTASFPTIVVLFIAVSALTVGEMLSSAGSWGLGFALAREERTGEYLGAFNVVSQGAQVIGPAIAVTVVAAGVTGWVWLGVAFAALGVTSPFVSRRAVDQIDAAGITVKAATVRADREPKPDETAWAIQDAQARE